MLIPAHILKTLSLPGSENYANPPLIILCGDSRSLMPLQQGEALCFNLLRKCTTYFSSFRILGSQTGSFHGTFITYQELQPSVKGKLTA